MREAVPVDRYSLSYPLAISYQPGRMGLLTNVGMLYTVLATYYAHVHPLLIFLS